MCHHVLDQNYSAPYSPAGEKDIKYGWHFSAIDPSTCRVRNVFHFGKEDLGIN